MLISLDKCNKYSDVELISMSAENMDFFSCIYYRYEKALLRYITRITSVPNAEAEDILQDAFIKIWKNLHAFDSSLKLSSWLYRIVHNETISHWRKGKNNEVTVSLSEGKALQVISQEIQVDQIDRGSLETCIAKLDEKYKEVVILKYLEDMSYEEISDILKIPEGTVATRLNRAKSALKSLYQAKRKNING